MRIVAALLEDVKWFFLQVMFTQFCKNDKNESTHKSRGIKKRRKKTARITTEETNEKKNYKPTSTQRPP